MSGYCEDCGNTLCVCAAYDAQRAAGGRVFWAAIDVGCHECGVASVSVGLFHTETEATAAASQRNEETHGWRDDGQTRCEVFRLSIDE